LAASGFRINDFFPNIDLKFAISRNIIEGIEVSLVSREGSLYPAGAPRLVRT
jgi:hypothetical protein